MRRLTYEFLARALRREPDEDFLAALRSEPCRSLLNPIPSELSLDALEQEYCRLFIGPPPRVSPYESMHRSGPGNGQLWGDAAVSVKRFVESLGLRYREDRNDLPDHVSVELELMARLIEAEATGDAEEASAARRAQRVFLRRHIAGWLPGFFRRLRGEAEESFYAAVAQLGGNFLREEMERFPAEPDAVHSRKETP